MRRHFVGLSFLSVETNLCPSATRLLHDLKSDPNSNKSNLLLSYVYSIKSQCAHVTSSLLPSLPEPAERFMVEPTEAALCLHVESQKQVQATCSLSTESGEAHN